MSREISRVFNESVYRAQINLIREQLSCIPGSRQQELLSGMVGFSDAYGCISVHRIRLPPSDAITKRHVR